MKSFSLVVIFVIFVILALFSTFARREGHQKKIQSQIESMGGKVINIEKRSFFTGLGPFIVVGEGKMVYRIEYQIGNDTKEGWVRFGGIMGPDWRL